MYFLSSGLTARTGGTGRLRKDRDVRKKVPGVEKRGCDLLP